MTDIAHLSSEAYVLYKSGDFHGATQILLQILEYCDVRDRLELEQHLLQCYWKLGNFDSMVQILEHQVKTQGDLKFDQRRWFSNCLRYQGLYARAEEITKTVPDAKWRDLDLGWYEHLRHNTGRAFELTELGRPDLGWSTVNVPVGTRRWRGEKISQLVLLEEAGDGDMILFARWIPHLLQRCDSIVYAGHSSLRDVFRRVWGVRVFDGWHEIHENHAALAMMSTAHQLGIDQPHAHVYLNANSDWQYYYSKLAPKTRPRIGICWSGAHRHAENHLRSVDPGLMISNLSDLAEILNLQMGALPLPGVIDTEFREWEQTLALISSCDAVVTVDTAVAHAAAAMGIATVVLTHRACYYTWQPEPPLSRSKWYPNAWNATPATPGDWNSAMQSARQQVIEILS